MSCKCNGRKSVAIFTIVAAIMMCQLPLLATNFGVNNQVEEPYEVTFHYAAHPSEIIPIHVVGFIPFEVPDIVVAVEVNGFVINSGSVGPAELPSGTVLRVDFRDINVITILEDDTVIN